MILRRLELKNFGRFDARTCEFRQGMNLVLGPSESGKSTLLEAVSAVLFGARDPERFRSWGSQGECSATLLFDASGETVRIERSLSENRIAFAAADADDRSLNRLPQGRDAAAEPLFREHLSRLFGSADEGILRLCLIIEQGATERFGADSPVWPAALAARRSDTPSSPSPETAAEQLEAVRRRLAELEKSWFATRAALESEPVHHERLATLEAEIAAERAELAEAQRSQVEVPRPPASPAERMDAQPLSGEMGQRREALERELAKTGLPRQMPSGLPAVLVQADDIRQEMIGIQKEAAALRQQLLKRQGPSLRPASVTTTLFLLSGAGLIWLRPGWLTIGLLAGGLVVALAWGNYLWRAGLERGERGRLKGQLQVLEDRRDEAQGRLTALDEEFSRLGLSPSVVEIVRMQKNLERHQRLLQELAEVEGALGVLEAGAVRQAAAAAADTSPPQEPESGSVQQQEELPARLALLAESIAAKEAEREELRRLSAGPEALRKELGRIEEEGESLRRSEAELQRQVDAGRSEPQAQAGDPVSNVLSDAFAEEVGQMLALITSGRYGAVRFDAEGRPSLRGGDGGWHPLGQFSRGTAACFHLAFRLVLGRHLAGGRRLPLFLDDPFSGLDQERQGEALKLLERLAAEYQVILFSRDETLRKRGARERWHMIDLSAAKGTKTAKGEERSVDDGQLHLL